MCRTIHAVLQTAICGIQMLVRVFMTIILMIENLIRMILQTMYNFISFILQMLSLIPICIVFLLTARLKCFMCGGGGPCPVNRGGACDCIMSAMAILIMFFIFRATGILDKIFYSLGYSKARPPVVKFVPTPGDITECSRNDTDYPSDETTTINDTYLLTDYYTISTPTTGGKFVNMLTDTTTPTNTPTTTIQRFVAQESTTPPPNLYRRFPSFPHNRRKWTTVLSFFQ
ncbi:unnamed protein product [Danaus chrysippus]|uniref:(African queen) hypothetical protein n=1 Tax=Danaus chrysippus TaxID=151541 RepID=A0A8J2QDS8_9NEOP|nr:unnamed protein product [Danaus chrysippus]